MLHVACSAGDDAGVGAGAGAGGGGAAVESVAVSYTHLTLPTIYSV